MKELILKIIISTRQLKEKIKSNPLIKNYFIKPIDSLYQRLESIPPSLFLLFFFIISIFIHLLIIIEIPSSFFSTPEKKKKKEEVVWTKLTPINLPQKKEKQLVDIKKPILEEKPKNSKNIGKYNQKVDPEKETVTSTSGETTTPLTPENSPQKKEPPKKEPKPKSHQGSQIDEIPKGFSNLNNNNQNYTKYNLPQPKLGDEYLANYKIGNRTYINAEANPQIFYFVELKSKFKLSWNPRRIIERNQSLRRYQRVTVVVGITIDKNGILKEMIIIRSSGNRAFDDEAKRAIYSSSPFTSPDEELLDEEGLLRSAWHFVVY